jgi:hypothetical protein
MDEYTGPVRIGDFIEILRNENFTRQPGNYSLPVGMRIRVHNPGDAFFWAMDQNGMLWMAASGEEDVHWRRITTGATRQVGETDRAIEDLVKSFKEEI